jgi:hypothetical protein
MSTKASFRFVMTLLAVVLFGPFPVQAEDLPVKTAGDISYVSGGVGASEQGALERVKSEYNLRLLFAVTGSGEFLASVPVTLTDESGREIFRAVSDGPYLYASVPAGAYQISAEHGGQVKKNTVEVPASGAASASFYWEPRQ